MTKQQLELSFAASPAFRPVIRRQRRLARAHWWFEQMHTVVNRVLDWQPAPAARPEQISLLPARRRW